MALTVHLDVLIAAHTAVMDAIDAAGASAYVLVKNSSNATLANLPLGYPCGLVDDLTGQLAFDIGAPDAEAEAGGTAHHADVCDKNGKVCLSMPCAQGTTPVADTFVMASLLIVLGAPVQLLSGTVG